MEIIPPDFMFLFAFSLVCTELAFSFFASSTAYVSTDRCFSFMQNGATHHPSHETRLPRQNKSYRIQLIQFIILETEFPPN